MRFYLPLWLKGVFKKKKIISYHSPLLFFFMFFSLYISLYLSLYISLFISLSLYLSFYITLSSPHFFESSSPIRHLFVLFNSNITWIMSMLLRSVGDFCNLLRVQVMGACYIFFIFYPTPIFSFPVDLPHLETPKRSSKGKMCLNTSQFSLSLSVSIFVN